MTIRTGTHYRGQTSNHSVHRLTESTSVNTTDGTIEPASMVLREDGNYNFPSGQITPFMRREDIGWQNLTFRNYYRDLPPAQQEKMIALSFWLYRNNAMAKRIIGMLIDFVWGDGVAINSKSKAVKDVLDDHWHDARNNWPAKGPQRMRDLFIYGEWLHRPQVFAASGRVQISTIQPDKIKFVVPSNESHEDLIGIVFKGVVMDEKDVPVNLRPNVIPIPSNVVDSTSPLPHLVMVQDYPAEIIHPIFDPTTGDMIGYKGDVFFFGINRTTDTTRGVGELFPLIDYIDLYDDVLFNRAERIATSAAMWWDLLYEGLTPAEIQAKLKDEIQLPPKPGSVFAHNEKVTLVQNTPTMGADDHERDVAVIRSHIIASAGFTGTMFDAPGDAGRAVGAEMAESVYKSMKTLQEQINQILRFELDYVLWQAKAAGLLTDADIKDGYNLTFPQPSSRDIARVGPAIFRLATAVNQMGTYMSAEEKRRVIIDQLNKQGMTDQPLEMDAFKPTEPAPPKPKPIPGGPLANGAPGATGAPAQGTGPSGTPPAKPAPAPTTSK